MNTVAILAGGKATRLYPLTLETPKALVRLNGKPFIEYQLELLARSGIDCAILCLGHFQNLVIDYINQVKNLFESKIEIKLSLEEKPLGTGGAVVNASELLGNEFGVLYGDSYLPIDYAEVFRKLRESDKKAVMTVYRNEGKFDKSNVEFYGSNIVKYSKLKPHAKMKYIDYGFLVFKREAFTSNSFPTQFDLSLVIENLVSRGEILGFEVANRFYEVGSFQGISDLEEYLRSENT